MSYVILPSTDERIIRGNNPKSVYRISDDNVFLAYVDRDIGMQPQGICKWIADALDREMGNRISFDGLKFKSIKGNRFHVYRI